MVIVCLLPSLQSLFILSALSCQLWSIWWRESWRGWWALSWLWTMKKRKRLSRLSFIRACTAPSIHSVIGTIQKQRWDHKVAIEHDFPFYCVWSPENTFSSLSFRNPTLSVLEKSEVLPSETIHSNLPLSLFSKILRLSTQKFFRTLYSSAGNKNTELEKFKLFS